MYYNQRTGKTLFQIFTVTKPNINIMHIIGTICLLAE